MHIYILLVKQCPVSLLTWLLFVVMSIWAWSDLINNFHDNLTHAWNWTGKNWNDLFNFLWDISTWKDSTIKYMKKFIRMFSLSRHNNKTYICIWWYFKIYFPDRAWQFCNQETYQELCCVTLIISITQLELGCSTCDAFLLWLHFSQFFWRQICALLCVGFWQWRKKNAAH